MGYYTTLVSSTTKFEMSEENIDLFVKLAQWLVDHEQEHGNGGSSTTRWYSWINASDLQETIDKRDPAGFFEAWDFFIDSDSDEYFYVAAYNSKSGQEEFMLSVMAPCLDGEMQWMGEDGFQYGFIFRDGLMDQCSVETKLVPFAHADNPATKDLGLV